MADNDNLYFSEREQGVVTPEIETLSDKVKDGIIEIFHQEILQNHLAKDFPQKCQDNDMVYGVDEEGLSKIIQAEFSGVNWPYPNTDEISEYELLDLVEFFGSHVEEPILADHHEWFGHIHIRGFNRENAFEGYREKVNRIFRRNGLTYLLDEKGVLHRKLPATLEQLVSAEIRSGDSELDGMIREAVSKFKEPELAERKLGLERLWHSWERLKTIRDLDKKKGWFKLRDEQFVENHWRETIEEEAGWLTKIGNTYQIRHKEVGKHPIEDPRDVDYLFFRLYSLIYRLLRN